jgi:hypothetical protein
MANEASFRFTVMHGYVSNEAMWSSSSRFDDVVAKARLAWRMRDPVLKYTVPVSIAFGNNKTCSVVIACQQDYSLWYVGSGDVLNPKPFTAVLTAYERASQARVLPLQDKEYHISMGYWSTVSDEVLAALQPKIVLRHSNCEDVILFDRPDVNGPSFGGWGRAIIKVRDVWHTRRPVFRYVDESPASGAMERLYVSIVDADDFSQWMRFRQPICRDLIVFDAATDEEFVPMTSKMMNEVGTPNQKRSEYENALAAQHMAIRRMDESEKERAAHVVLESRFTALNLQRDVGMGSYGPSFTTAARPSGKDGQAEDADRGTRQFESLVQKFSAAEKSSSGSSATTVVAS